ncbi:MAG: hypothetical protein ABIK19_04310 [candidate division WOR-3 bacterium]
MKRIILVTMVLVAVVLAIGNTDVKVITNSDVKTITQKINYQGYLTDNSSNPITNPSLSITFKIYDDEFAGSVQWEATKNVSVENGVFSTLLDVPANVFTAGAPRWLELTIGGNALTPRTELTAVGYSYKTIDADKLEGNTLSDLDVRYGYAGGAFLPLAGGTMTGPITNTGDPSITMGKGNFGSGNINSGTMAFVAGGNNRARGPYSVISGGGGPELADSNSASGNFSTVSGGKHNSASGYYATVGGGHYNSSSYWHATVSGGSLNSASGDYTTIGGGYDNSASTFCATVSGGWNNSASGNIATVGGGYDNSASGSTATVGGGIENSASDTSATVSGGKYNRARGIYSVVSGGGGSSEADSNSALGGYSTVSGGRHNSASGWYATVGGGYYNSASYIYATVGGGKENSASSEKATVSGGEHNSASNSYATVSGGNYNSASGTYATVGGGCYNYASGLGATVVGGDHNSASGEKATVAGGYQDSSAAPFSFTTNFGSKVPISYSGSAAFNGQIATGSGQTRVGALSKASGTFTIDHPLDPMNKILNHYFVESPEMVLIYRGSVVIGADGKAVVHLPDYFDALNQNPMIQLTGVGTSDVYVLEKVKGNQFAIGGKPGTEVYWIVTGDRKDQSAEITRIIMPVEQTKDVELRGRSLDDDFLCATKEQLDRMGKGNLFNFRTTFGQLKYENSKQRPIENEIERMKK